ncbi:MAG: hypothetical protein HEQ32_03580 [Vampirovibrio sp.]
MLPIQRVSHSQTQTKQRNGYITLKSFEHIHNEISSLASQEKRFFLRLVLHPAQEAQDLLNLVEKIHSLSEKAQVIISDTQVTVTQKEPKSGDSQKLKDTFERKDHSLLTNLKQVESALNLTEKEFDPIEEEPFDKFQRLKQDASEKTEP